MAERTTTNEAGAPARGEPRPLSADSGESVREPIEVPAAKVLDQKALEAGPNARRSRRRPAGTARSAVPANDDVPTIGNLILALHQKPSQRPYFVAAAISGLWFVLSSTLGYVLLASQVNGPATLGALLGQPAVLPVFTAVVAPIPLVWFLARLDWRSKELRQMSSAMTEVAVRLAEPDRLAEQSIASLGQSVRRQIVYMTDAIGHAIGRASELEGMVHNEVAALERSYTENELRVRSLIQELASEREALQNNSSRVSSTLHGIGSQITHEITSASRQATESLTEASRALAQLIETRSGAIAASATAAGETIDQKLSERGNSLLNSLSVMTQRIGSEVPIVIERMSAEQVRLSKIIEQATGNLGALEEALANRTHNLGVVLEDQTRAVDRSFAEHAQSLGAMMEAQQRNLQAGLEHSVNSIDAAIERGTQTLEQSVSQRTLMLANAMEAHARSLSESLARKSLDLDHTLMQGIESVRRTSENITKQSVLTIEGLANQASLLKDVSENLLQQINTLTTRFESQGKVIMKAAHSLETSNLKVDTVLQARHSELSELLQRMDDRARSFDDKARSYSRSVDDVLNAGEERARELANTFTRATEERAREAAAQLDRFRDSTQAATERTLSAIRDRLSVLSEEVRAHLTNVSSRTSDAALDMTRNTLSQSQEAERTISDLRQRLQSVSNDVAAHLSTMTTRFDETSEEVRRRTSRTADEIETLQARLRSQMESLPSTSQATADSIRRALQDQLAALEQLSSIAGTHRSQRDVAPPVPNAPAALAPPARGRARAGTGHASVPPQGKPAGVRERRGWSLGDLLDRASRDEQAEAARQSPPVEPEPVTTRQQPRSERPEVISMANIAQALDPVMAADVWTKLRSGLRGVISRDIYTDDGQRTFDEIARRFQADAGFRGSVNQYLDDFERMLADAEAREAGGRIGENYLISETGRVYLLLAHVSGRIV